MHQADLFSMPPTPRLSRRNDPATSHTAAERLRASGKLNAQRQRVLDAPTRWPGSTAVELASHSGLDRYAVSRRLPDLAQAGLVRRMAPRVCRVNGSAQTTRWPR